MRTKLIVLALFGLALVGADSAMASDHPPCEPSCDFALATGDGDLLPAIAPVLVAMTALWLAPRVQAKDPSS